MLKIYILNIELHIRLYDRCGADLGRSVADSEVKDNIHAIGVVKLVFGYPALPLTAPACNQTDTHLKVCE